MSKQIFEGLKVADFAWVGVGPQVGRELAQHGALSIRIESHRIPDSARLLPPFRDGKPGVDRSAFGTAYNTNKYSVAMDLTKPRGVELAKQLVAWADLVTESFTPGTMAKFGLDYESCKKIKPDIIYFSTCMMGQSGPLKNYGAYGLLGVTYAGYSNLLGLPDRDPLPVFNNYSDFIAPWHLTTAVIAALIRRKKTGKGMYLDQSQVEAGVSFLGPTILDYEVNNRIAERMGNKDPNMAPHGIYPCAGEDRWVALTVTNEFQWKAFCKVVGNPDWCRDEKFATFLTRKANEEELNEFIENWSRQYSAEKVMTLMQKEGVPCGAVRAAEDLMADPQLKHREHFRVLEHPVIGEHVYNAPAYRLSKTPNHIHKAGPCLGEDIEFVYKEILGLTDDDISDLFVEGVITTDADVPGGE